MKLSTAVAKSLLMAASIGVVVPLSAQTPPKPKPDTTTKEKAEPEPKIEGITIARKDGRFLGLTVEGVQFKVRFYDAKKKPEAADVARASARWSPANVKAEQRTVLNPADGCLALVSPGVVRPPLTFRVFFTLFSANDEVIETFTVEMHP